MRARTFVIAALALVVAGCGGSGQKSQRSGSSAPQGGILRIGTTDVVASFNPYNAQTLQTGVANSMVYPQLIQYGYRPKKGYEVIPDFAESWKVSKDGKTIAFHTRPGAKWSDGAPLTARDAAWTINTTVRFVDGPTAQLSPPVTGVRRAEAVDDTTVVVHYDKPLGNALTLLAARLPVLPRHVWEAQAKGNGRGLRTFRPEARPGGLVSGGPYRLKQYEKKGTTVYEPNPRPYGPRSNAEAIALTYYTNQDAMLEHLKAGELDLVEEVPSAAVAAVQRDRDLDVVTAGSATQADLFFNSNPRKPAHRELLNPRVKEALAMCVDRRQIVDVVFHGHAQPVETLVGSLGGELQNTELGPRPYDCDRAGRILDELGYRRGSGGIRVVPGEPGQRMAYEVITSSVQPFNADRAVEILRKGWERIGVKVTQKVAGDETATWTHLTGADCDPKTSKGYDSWDIEVGYSVAEVDPLNTLAGELKASWCVLNFTGYDSPAYDRLHERALTELDPARRKQLVWRMQKLYFDSGATIPLAEEKSIYAYSRKWTGFASPEVRGYSKLYYTAPRRAG